MLPARTADNSTVLVVPNVNVRMETQHSVPPVSLHDLLWEREGKRCNFNETMEFSESHFGVTGGCLFYIAIHNAETEE